MPGEILSTGHDCDKPGWEGLGHNAVWKCGECGRKWRLRKITDKSYYWFLYTGLDQFLDAIFGTD